MLHIMRHAFSTVAFQACLQQRSDKDALLLIESAVYALSDSAAQATLQRLSQQGQLYVLAEDLQARGLQPGLGQLVDYSGFVSLSETHTPCYTW